MAIAVTGSTGYVGGLVAASLESDGIEQALLVRDPSRAPALAGASVHAMEYGDPDSSVRALAGHELLFMVSGKEAKDRLADHLSFVEAARVAGIRHIVYTSFFGAAPNAIFTLARDHYATEQAIRASGMAFTFLRDNLYLDFLPMLAGEDGVIRGPAAHGRAGVVARRDVADVAGVVLRDPAAHVGVTYQLTGPEALSLSEVAEIMTAETGREYAYEQQTLDEAYASRRRWSGEQWLLDSWVSTYTAIAAGELDAVTTTVADLTGHPATSLVDFLRQRR